MRGVGIRGLVSPPLAPLYIGLWVMQEKKFWGSNNATQNMAKEIFSKK